jgi:hypothetical protein
VKLIPLAYAILFSFFTVPTVAQADPKKPANGPRKPVAVVVPEKAYEPHAICGVIAGHAFTIPLEYTNAGAIFDADKAGEGCGQSVIIAGLYMNLQDASPAPKMATTGYQSVYLMVGAIASPYELGARKAVDDDIVQRSIAQAAEQEVYPSSISRTYGKLNDGHYWGHEYFYARDASGAMTPYKMCKTFRERDMASESCEFIYQDEKLGLAFRVGFDPNAQLDYNQVRSQAMVMIEKLINKS